MIQSITANTSYADNGKAILYNVCSLHSAAGVFSHRQTRSIFQLFDNEPDLPNYTAFLMSRSDIGISDGGILTVCMYTSPVCKGGFSTRSSFAAAEVLANMTDVLKAPVLESPVPASWIAYLQSVTANGNKLTGHSAWVDTYMQQLLIAVIDSLQCQTEKH